MANRASCKGCIYHRPIGGQAAPHTEKICYYALDTGELRDCPVENCNKKFFSDSTQVPEKIEQQILTLRRRGSGVRAIAASVGVPTQIVSKICKNKVEEKTMKGYKVSEEEKQKVLELREMGASMRAIADILGTVSRSTVGRICKENELTKEKPAPAEKTTNAGLPEKTNNNRDIIIPQKDEAVKLELPEAVKTAITERLQTLASTCADSLIEEDDFYNYIQEISELNQFVKECE